MQPTRKSNGASQPLFPYLALLLAGFTSRPITRPERGLLHLDFTIAAEGLAAFRWAVYFLWHFPSDLSAPALPGAMALWSSDFPHFIQS